MKIYIIMYVDNYLIKMKNNIQVITRYYTLLHVITRYYTLLHIITRYYTLLQVINNIFNFL